MALRLGLESFKVTIKIQVSPDFRANTRIELTQTTTTTTTTKSDDATHCAPLTTILKV